MTPQAVALPARIERLEAFLFRVPLTTPRVNSFGTMTHRSALAVRLTDADGAQGWGEAFSNWPAFGAEHRQRIIREVLAPLLAGNRFSDPPALTRHLIQGTRILRIQTDERGPFDQAIAAVDIAAWDLAARREDVPLYRALGGPMHVAGVPYYASGLSPDRAVEIALREAARGANAFKCKVGFGLDTDIAMLGAVREAIGPSARLMVDANQKWSVDEAAHAIKAMAPFALEWVEEPIAADHPPNDFAALAAIGPPIAAGENVRGDASFDAMMTVGGLKVVQPDIIKWGGITGCRAIARTALSHGLRYCPHYLGGGIGLMATAHLLAAVGGDGLLELDVTPNALRSLLANPFPAVHDGLFALPEGPGIATNPDLDALGTHRTGT